MWTLGPVPSGSDTECTLRSQALGALMSILQIESLSHFGAFLAHVHSEQEAEMGTYKKAQN